MRIGVGLSIPELATRGGKFSPASLFSGGVQGAWYAPDDFSTLFQDSAGTTPVTAVEQPVGLMLDKSQGLVLGSDVVVNGDFATDTNWTKGAGWTISGGSANLVAGGYPIISQNFSYTLGAWYQVTFTVTNRVSAIVQFLTSPGRQKGPQTSANGTYTFLFLASAGDTYIGIQDQNGVGSLSIDNLIVKQLSGNHASQATAASRPVLRARYNLLTYSEQFDNAVWTKISATVSANASVAPDGTTTADRITASAASSGHYLAQGITTVAATYTYSVRAKYTNNQWIALRIFDGTSSFFGSFDIQNGVAGAKSASATTSITSLGNGWYQLNVTATCVASASSNVVVALNNADSASIVTWTPAGTETADIWGADLRTGSSAGTYQRIAAATDYATAGFLPYLALDGTDDSFGTNSIDFTATDKMSVCAGVTKLSDAATGMVTELSATSDTNNGAFYVVFPVSNVDTDLRFNVRGTASNQRDYGPYAAPTTRVLYAALTTNAATSALAISARIDGAAQTGSNTVTAASTGNFGTYPLYIGRRNNASLPFNGRIYQLIVCGKELSASELASTEAYVNSKTGAY